MCGVSCGWPISHPMSCWRLPRVGIRRRSSCSGCCGRSRWHGPKTVRLIFERYLDLGCVMALRTELERLGIRSKRRVTEAGRERGGASFSRGALYHLLKNRVYRGETVHKGTPHPGEHVAVLAQELWNAVV